MPTRQFTIVHDPPPPAITTDAARRVARLFHLDRAGPAPATNDSDVPALLPAGGQILLVLGASGSGKSTLLRQLTRSDRDLLWIDPGQLDLAGATAIDCFDLPVPLDEPSLRDVLRRLCAVGLAETWTWLRPPAQLSDGQRWRLRLAVALHRIDRLDPTCRSILVIDEFACVLDRVTALLLARTLRRQIDRRADRLAAIVATVRHDLASALCPDHIARCDFGTVEVRSCESPG